tara:strand:- start:852 stop:1328 length:477 start_codon:yes stop_codon:yes gene_type:complete
MIHGTYGSNIESYLSLLESQINDNVATTNLRYLFKCTNDMTKDVKYAYGTIIEINDRFVRQRLTHNTTDAVLTGNINFKPFGFWTYEVYEVSWVGTVDLSTNKAPTTETEVLSPAANDKGVVQGLVHRGKIKIQETVGSEQIQYTQHTATETNYLYTD